MGVLKGRKVKYRKVKNSKHPWEDLWVDIMRDIDIYMFLGESSLDISTRVMEEVLFGKLVYENSLKGIRGVEMSCWYIPLLYVSMKIYGFWMNFSMFLSKNIERPYYTLFY